jgi:hypothetical protein
MKTFFAMLVTTAMLAGLSAPADAASRHKKKKQVRYRTYAPKIPANHDQPEYTLSKVPFGSQLWWQQFERERGVLAVTAAALDFNLLDTGSSGVGNTRLFS